MLCGVCIHDYDGPSATLGFPNQSLLTLSLNGRRPEIGIVWNRSCGVSGLFYELGIIPTIPKLTNYTMRDSS